MRASSSAGVALVIWAAAVEPADVPMIRSASVTSNPASNRPAMTPISHALPADPPPPRTNARSLTIMAFTLNRHTVMSRFRPTERGKKLCDEGQRVDVAGAHNGEVSSVQSCQLHDSKTFRQGDA